MNAIEFTQQIQSYRWYFDGQNRDLDGSDCFVHKFSNTRKVRAYIYEYPCMVRLCVWRKTRYSDLGLVFDSVAKAKEFFNERYPEIVWP